MTNDAERATWTALARDLGYADAAALWSALLRILAAHPTAARACLTTWLSLRDVPPPGANGAAP